MAQEIVDRIRQFYNNRKKMKYYNELPPDYLKRMIGEEERCQLCWEPYVGDPNWCNFCYGLSDEKTVIINKSTLSWTLNNRGKSGRLRKMKAKKPLFKIKKKRRIKKQK